MESTETKRRVDSGGSGRQFRSHLPDGKQYVTGFNSRTVTGPHGHRFPNSVRVMRSGAALQMPTDSEFSTDSKWQELGGSEQAVWYLQLLDETRPSVALLQSHGCGDAERARATETFSKHLGEAYGTGTENANLSRRLHLIMTFGAGETQAELAAELLAMTSEN